MLGLRLARARARAPIIATVRCDDNGSPRAPRSHSGGRALCLVPKPQDDILISFADRTLAIIDPVKSSGLSPGEGGRAPPASRKRCEAKSRSLIPPPLPRVGSLIINFDGAIGIASTKIQPCREPGLRKMNTLPVARLIRDGDGAIIKSTLRGLCGPSDSTFPFRKLISS